jgi:O-antigen biosynthesis protein WbqP
MIKRIFDLMLSFAFIFVLIIPSIFIAILIRLTSSGDILYWSKRVGKNNIIFKMPKFRTMKINTPQLATHLLINSSDAITPFGNFLRKYSLDEIPQLWSILKGDMSFVGPRPALFNQYDLIALRSAKGIHKLLPGLSGWAQINGRDDLEIEAKVTKDIEYLERQSFLFDLQIIWLTILKVIKKDGVSH